MAAAHRPLEPGKIIIELAATALVVAALTITLVGFHVKDVPGGFDLVTRFGDVLAAVIIAVIGRCWLIGLREGYPWLVVLTALPAAVILILALLFIPTFAEVLPFNSSVVQWLVAIFAAGMGLAAMVRMSRAGPEAADDAAAGEAEPVDFMDRVNLFIQQYTVWIAAAFLLIALVLPFLPGMNLSTLDIAVLVLTYVMLGWGLNIVVGLAGLLDLGYVAFYAVGAYSFGLLASPESPVLEILGIVDADTPQRKLIIEYAREVMGALFVADADLPSATRTGISFWFALPFAGLMAALAGVLLGFPVLRLRGDYLAIVTLGFGEMIRVTLLNFVSLTNGPDGISKIPPPGILGYSTQPVMDNDTLQNTTEFSTAMGWAFDPYDNTVFLYYLILIMALLTNWFTVRIRTLPVGRAWEALREDEIACKSLGINPVNTKLTAFALGAMFGGFAGSFFATRQGFISPESFTFIESAVILAIVVLGGFGSQIGVVVASFILIGLPEIFRELKDFRMLFFGASMVLIMLWRPSGLLAHREPTIRLRAPPSGGGAALAKAEGDTTS